MRTVHLIGGKSPFPIIKDFREDKVFLGSLAEPELLPPEHQAAEAFMMLAALVVAFPLIFELAHWLRG
jgi:hypothetical protein